MNTIGRTAQELEFLNNLKKLLSNSNEKDFQWGINSGSIVFNNREEIFHKLLHHHFPQYTLETFIETLNKIGFVEDKATFTFHMKNFINDKKNNTRKEKCRRKSTFIHEKGNPIIKKLKLVHVQENVQKSKEDLSSLLNKQKESEELLKEMVNKYNILREINEKLWEFVTRTHNIDEKKIHPTFVKLIQYSEHLGRYLNNDSRKSLPLNALQPVNCEKVNNSRAIVHPISSIQIPSVNSSYVSTPQFPFHSNISLDVTSKNGNNNEILSTTKTTNESFQEQPYYYHPTQSQTQFRHVVNNTKIDNTANVLYPLNRVDHLPGFQAIFQEKESFQNSFYSSKFMHPLKLSRQSTTASTISSKSL